MVEESWHERQAGSGDREIPLKAADLGIQVRARAEGFGFQRVGFTSAIPSPHQEAYRAWIAKGYHGSMEYMARHLAAKADPQTLLPGARSVIAVALNYNQPNPSRKGYPRIARYALGRDYHRVLRSRLRSLSKAIEALEPGAKNRICVDSAPILERDYAHLAGLGWFGKNTCLIDSKRGSWFFIGLILTTLHLPPDEPAIGGCGSCRACVDACPTGAILHEDGRWQVDARRCISYLTIEHRGPLEFDTAGWTFGCDVCQEVCPFNQERDSQPDRARLTTLEDFVPTRAWPSLEQLRQISYEDWDALTQGSATRRAGYDGLKRNAEANLRKGEAEGPREGAPKPTR